MSPVDNKTLRDLYDLRRMVEFASRTPGIDRDFVSMVDNSLARIINDLESQVTMKGGDARVLKRN